MKNQLSTLKRLSKLTRIHTSSSIWISCLQRSDLVSDQYSDDLLFYGLSFENSKSLTSEVFESGTLSKLKGKLALVSADLAASIAYISRSLLSARFAEKNFKKFFSVFLTAVFSRI